ncbi:hypothetical protein [Limnoglobus roseus]|uniref:Uncharacterized protein n=1 Tax=Limnoglobus roseus TaxID=2598579 RepID=A0A5C1A849_9BACT|nr:hypothetical protein [Limnoglobus roseus]QEL14675.1 hypothetical protein PX52LOC_01568 [Limnoglobus roseus]
MASQTELIARDARELARAQKTELDILNDTLAAYDLPRVRERIAVLESQFHKFEVLLNELKPTRAEAEELGALKSRLSQLEDQKKLGDSRLFQFIMLFVGGVITLSVQIALLFFKK